MAPALDIADWLVELCADQLGAPIDAMSLEKQMYYAQSFHMALGRGALFPEDFQAWKGGPVVRNVWSYYQGPGPITKRRRRLFGPARDTSLPDETAAFLHESVRLFSALSTFQLSEATHQEGPWSETRGDLPKDAKSERVIAKEAMRDYYAAIMVEGEDALSRHALLGTVPEPRWGWFYIAGIANRRMFVHPMYPKAISAWGAERKLWEVPEEEVYPDALYPAPPAANVGRTGAIRADSVEQLRSELKKLHH